MLENFRANVLNTTKSKELLASREKNPVTFNYHLALSMLLHETEEKHLGILKQTRYFG